ncbi:MAG: glycine--tRNA ligase [Verrucomicrobiales bacterium]|nr:glycine--tRNA ligase [Verrucomicrobiales bacterium]|tara:strand:- start:4369 stop:6318 length:1950 start_codon:yes stop_codon:yes gene_type:complete
MAEPKQTELMEKIVSLCKRRGFVYQSSEIYGGIGGFWDYGPLGAELKRNVKDAWWRDMVQHREDIAGLDATIITHPTVWKASGHVDTFTDPMVDCLLTQARFRADQVDPQSGTAHRFAGALDGSIVAEDSALHRAFSEYVSETGSADYKGDNRKKLLEKLSGALEGDNAEDEANRLIDSDLRKALNSDEFAVLVPKGKPPEKAHKTARQFYGNRNVQKPLLLPAGTSEETDTIKYNPENGALLTEPRAFNLMFTTHVGPVKDDANIAYLRPETAQAIFVQFKNVLDTSPVKVPFGIAQVGKAFRNEVTPRNFTFRSREFEQMEIEYFIKPDEAVEAISGQVAEPSDGEPQADWGWNAWHKYWFESRIRWYESVGLNKDNLHIRWQDEDELAHYARATVDIEFDFPFGQQELEGIAARSDFDLSQHQLVSGKSQLAFDDELKQALKNMGEEKANELADRYRAARHKYLSLAIEDEDRERQEKKVNKLADADRAAFLKGNYIPHVIEPSAGADRLVLALICTAYAEEEITNEKGKKEMRTVMRFNPRIAPIKVGVFPLLKNKPELVAKAKEVKRLLQEYMTVFYDEGGNIGRRYRRQDEAGTPFGVTIDFETLGEAGDDLKDTVTLRHRDSMEQERVKIGDLVGKLLPQVR